MTARFVEGRRYGYMVVLHRIGTKSVQCRCDCGREKAVRLEALARGATKSCGCKAGELLRATQRHNRQRRQALGW